MSSEERVLENGSFEVIEENWKSLIKPRRVDTHSTGSHSATLVIEPLERGFGLTIGNALRRILLSCLHGAAVVGIQVEGILHEFSSIPGVREHVTDIVLNLKQLTVRMSGAGRKKLILKKKGPAVVTAADIQVPSGVEIINPDLVICSVNEGASIAMEIVVGTGLGYVSAEMNKDPNAPVGFIPIDSLFSPIKKVAYRVENAREGKILDYDRLIMDIDTNGAVLPKDAAAYGARILQEQLSVFINFKEPKSVSHQAEQEVKKINPALLKKVSELELSVRSHNCLQNDNIVYLGDLVMRTESEMLRTPNFGRKSLDEIKLMLAGFGLKLGMTDIDWPPENLEESVKKQAHHY